MQWVELSDEVDQHLKKLKREEKNPAWIELIVKLIDLTSLNDTDTEASIASLCEKAQTTVGHVAAVCTYPRFTRLVAATLAHTEVKVATVANFPKGNSSLETTLIEIAQALQDGAQEIDIVFPYERYLQGDHHYAQSFISTCKAAMGIAKLKVILETGVLRQREIIAKASEDALLAGADFIKTSTGKIAEGATPEAVALMLLVIAKVTPMLKRQVGLKVSGGIRSFDEAVQYIQLADRIMGRKWVTPDTFRIGTSKLLDELVSQSL